MDQQQKNEIDAKLKAELEIFGAVEKETLKDVATRRMWQAMPDLMRERAAPKQ